MFRAQRATTNTTTSPAITSSPAKLERLGRLGSVADSDAARGPSGALDVGLIEPEIGSSFSFAANVPDRPVEGVESEALDGDPPAAIVWSS